MRRFGTWLASPIFWGGVMVLAWLLTRSGAAWVVPGVNANWIAGVLGVWQGGDVALHPLSSALFVFGRAGSVLPAGSAVAILNVFAGLLSAGCVVVLCAWVREFFRAVVVEPRSKAFAEQAIRWAVPVAGVIFILSPDVLRASWHLQWQIVDLFLILGGCLLAVRAARIGLPACFGVASFAWGLLAPEAPATLMMAPFVGVGLIVIYCKTRDRVSVKPILKHIVFPMAVGALITLTGAVLLGLWAETAETVRSALSLFVRAQVAGVLEAQAGSWILLGFFGVLPFILALFSGLDVGNNRRSVPIVGVYLTIGVLVVVALLPVSVAPSALAHQWADACPILISAMTAFAAAFVVGGGILLLTVKVPAEGRTERAFARRFAGLVATLAIPAVLLVGIGCGILESVRVVLAEAPLEGLPRRVADEVMGAAQAQDETWLLSNGAWDSFLALRRWELGAKVHLFSLAQDKQPKAMASLRKTVEESPYFEKRVELRDQLERALDLGMIPFVQDWLRADAGAVERFITVSLPDLWFTGNRYPLPEKLWFRGSENREKQHEALASYALEGSTSLAEVPECAPKASGAWQTFCALLRRQVGFVANDIAFFLADAGKKEEAYQLVSAVYAYDPENVAAFFNIFELVNGGMHPERKEWCEREFNALLKRTKGRRYHLWALSRTFGYIRSPQVIGALAGSWALSGQTGAALSGIDLVMEMLDDDQRTAVQGTMAAIYNIAPGKRAEAKQRYRSFLEKTADKRQQQEAVRQLYRIALAENNLEEAKALLERAEKLNDAKELAYERALYYATAGEAGKAKEALKKCIELNAKNPEVFAMLATLQLQTGEEAELRQHTLQKLIRAAGTEDNYFVQIVQAQLAERENALPKARAAYLRALALNSSVPQLVDAVLTLDIRLNDRTAAERHAREALYQNRESPLANYVMGSLALSEGDLKRAERYLRVATAPGEGERPLPEAFNDLAETLRREGKWLEALAAAQRACELAPKLSVAHETVAAILLELQRYAEADAELDTAEKLSAENNAEHAVDPRILITRARLREREGRLEEARAVVAQVSKRQDQLSDEAKREVETLRSRLLPQKDAE